MLFEKKPKLVSNVSDIAKMYKAVGGCVIEVVPGCIGWGITVCIAPGYKAAVIKEVFLTTQSCGHTVKFYNRLPKKYEVMIAKLEEGEE